jgi:TatD DNase family protein
MIDTHCHIHFRAYGDDMDEVIKRTQDRRVRMITIGTQSDTSKDGIKVAEKHEGLWCTVGLHPSHTHAHTLHVDEDESINTREETFDKDFYRDLARSSNKVVAIGEVGLDYFRLPEDLTEAEKVKSAQESSLRSAIELADEIDLPLVLHVRDAHEKMIEIIKEFVDDDRLSRRGVVHCFTGTIEEARAYHGLGFYTSFTGIITFEDRKDPAKVTPLQKVVQDVPLEWLMLETDSPYLTPHPFRGERNEPWRVESIGEKVSFLKGVSIKEVEEVTDSNAKKLFRIG